MPELASGNFTTISGVPGVTFAFAPSTGVLSVTAVQSVNLIPTNIISSVSGGVLKLAWPGDPLGWDLQSNSINILVPADWFTITGSALVTNESLTIGTNDVFFRLHHN